MSIESLMATESPIKCPDIDPVLVKEIEGYIRYAIDNDHSDAPDEYKLSNANDLLNFANQIWKLAKYNICVEHRHNFPGLDSPSNYHVRVKKCTGEIRHLLRRINAALGEYGYMFVYNGFEQQLMKIWRSK